MRYLEVYPKAVIRGSTWALTVKVFDQTTRVQSRFERTDPASVTAEQPLGLLKVVFTLTTDDTTVDQDVMDALTVDDIKPGGGYQTVWGNWREIAESKITPGITLAQFLASWSKQQTAAVRSDAHRALQVQRGWQVTSVHQHEGDRTVTQ